jgi:serine/threonine protein kinase
MAGFPVAGDTYAGRYTVVRELGHGRSGTVFEAHDPVLDRPVALTVVVPSLADRGGYQDRFAREAAALARIRSRHVVGIHEYGEHDGTVYAVTQYFPDGDLENWLESRGPLDRADALRLVAEVCQGLADAHDVGVVHGDVRPEAVLLWQQPDGLVPYLRDLGVVGGNEQHLAPDGAMVGTPAWMPPERHFGHPADERGDVYGAGCLLWASLTGAAPYSGTDFQTVNAHINDPVPQLPDGDEVDERINRVLAAAMAKSPEERTTSASELRVRLLHVLHGLQQAAPEPVPADEPRSQRMLHWALACVVLAVAIGVVALSLS